MPIYTVRTDRTYVESTPYSKFNPLFRHLPSLLPFSPILSPTIFTPFTPNNMDAAVASELRDEYAAQLRNERARGVSECAALKQQLEHQALELDAVRAKLEASERVSKAKVLLTFQSSSGSPRRGRAVKGKGSDLNINRNTPGARRRGDLGDDTHETVTVGITPRRPQTTRGTRDTTQGGDGGGWASLRHTAAAAHYPGGSRSSTSTPSHDHALVDALTIAHLQSTLQQLRGELEMSKQHIKCSQKEHALQNEVHELKRALEQAQAPVEDGGNRVLPLEEQSRMYTHSTGFRARRPVVPVHDNSPKVGVGAWRGVYTRWGAESEGWSICPDAVTRQRCCSFKLSVCAVLCSTTNT